MAQSLELARFWYRQAAENGSMHAQFNLGLHLQHENRLAEARRWFWAG